MRLTLVQPCIGRRPGERYLRSWQMEPLSLAVLAGLTPPGVEVRLVDDRLESLPYDAPTDLVAITVETYTAQRAYQIATEYRRRGVPVVMGGFHAMLQPDEVAVHAESVVLGEAEGIWAELIDDYRHGRPRKSYRSFSRPWLGIERPDRRIYRGKNYLPLGLVESSRGCPYCCEFCAIHSAYGSSRSVRPVDAVVQDVLAAASERKLIFMVDDNVGADPAGARELLESLRPHGVPWVSQCSIQGALDEDWTALLASAGCKGVLIGFESMEKATLHAMDKPFNDPFSYRRALANLRRHGIAIYGTFVLGYDDDTLESLDAAVAFAREERFFLAAFAPLMPFPGTPLYRRLESENRLLHPKWWLDPNYLFGQVVYRPQHLSAQEIRDACLAARRSFYSWSSICSRAVNAANCGSASMAFAYTVANLLHRREMSRRDGHPLGDEAFIGSILPA